MENNLPNHSILVTGGAGFIGSNFIPYFIEQYPNYNVINIDKLTYAGNITNLAEVEGNPRYNFIRGDICNRELLEYIFASFDIKGVIHFAAESHVDNSINGPDVFIHTNVEGTFTVLDVARRFWMKKPHVYRAGYERCRFHHISTDEVYGSLGETGRFTESTAYAPNSPYSASKASADMIVRSYFHTYGVNVVITNCSNNYGPKQHAEKLIPTIIRKALTGKGIPIYGDGKNVRDWLYVLDHCKGIDIVYHNGQNGESYNIGGNNEQENIELALMICDILDIQAVDRRNELGLSSYRDLITFVKDRPGHDLRYAIEAKKIESKLGFRANNDFQSCLKKTITWFIERGEAR